MSWTGAGDGTSWKDPANWDALALPTAADTAVISANGTYTVVSDSSLTAKHLTLGGGTGVQSLSLAAGTLTIIAGGTNQGTLTVASGATLALQDQGSDQFVNQTGATVTLDGGDITGATEFVNSGTVEKTGVGASVIESPFLMDQFGVLNLLSDQLGLMDQVQLGGTTSLSDQTQLALSDQLGDTSDVVIPQGALFQMNGAATVSGARAMAISGTVEKSGVGTASIGSPFLMDQFGVLNLLSDQLGLMDQVQLGGTTSLNDQTNLALSDQLGDTSDVVIPQGAMFQMNGAATVSGVRAMAVSGMVQKSGAGLGTIASPFLCDQFGTLELLNDQLGLMDQVILGGTTSLNDQAELQLNDQLGDTSDVVIPQGATFLMNGATTVSGNRALANSGSVVKNSLGAATVASPFLQDQFGSFTNFQDQAEFTNQFVLSGLVEVHAAGLLALTSGTDPLAINADGTLRLVGGSISIANGVSLDGNLIVANGGSVSFGSDQIVAGSGQISFEGTGSSLLAALGTTTISSGVSIFGGDGTSTTIGAVGALRKDGSRATATLVNAGTITADSSGVITLTGDWTNTGTVEATNGGTVEVDGTFPSSALSGFDTADGTLRILGAMDNTLATFTIGGLLGEPELKGGTITGGTIAATSGESIRMTSFGGTLSGVTLDAGVAHGPEPQGLLTVRNGLTLNGSLLFGGGAKHGTVTFDSTQTLDGTGEIVFADPGNNAQSLQVSSGTLTVGPDVTIRGEKTSIGLGAGTFVNQGTVRSDVAGRTLTLDGTGWINEGTVEAVNGATLDLKGTFGFEGGQFVAQTGTVRLVGTLENTGRVFALSPATGSIDFLGRIQGGTVTGPPSDPILFNGGTLDGVTDMSATMRQAVYNASPLYVENGLTLNGPIELSAGLGKVRFVGSQILSGTGEINMSHQ
ncbi:hypothetical protein K8I85_03650, partial [bacterium]|nr:hypothetical protein [bacterium]